VAQDSFGESVARVALLTTIDAGCSCSSAASGRPPAAFCAAGYGFRVAVAAARVPAGGGGRPPRGPPQRPSGGRSRPTCMSRSSGETARCR
jgi:hypothetical protein